ncbi:MAG: response regulator transcription factor [Bacteroidales bacterium]
MTILSNPSKPKVLVSRIRALLREAGRPRMLTSMAPVELWPVTADTDRERFVLMKKGKEIFLPRKEFELMNLLISRPGKVFTRDEIFKRVWGDDIIVGDRTIDVHIRKLREKVGNDIIQTIKGVGYKLNDEL